MKTLRFTLEGSPVDEWYDGGISTFDVDLEDGEVQAIESFAKELGGYVTEEDLEGKFPDLAEKVGSGARRAFLDELVLESWNSSGADILDPDLAGGFDEDEFKAMEPSEAADYLRRFGADVEMVDVTYSYSFGPAD